MPGALQRVRGESIAQWQFVVTHVNMWLFLISKGDWIEMKINKLYIVIGLIFAFGLFFALAAHADERNQETLISFSAPIQIPGHVLPAGTYRFQLAEPGDELQMVRIYNADGTVLYATLQTVAAQRSRLAEDVVVTLAAPQSGGPEYLVKWFYRGNTDGHEFVYSKPQEREIARAAQESFLANKRMPAENAGN
jgi:hypothetical protein